MSDIISPEVIESPKIQQLTEFIKKRSSNSKIKPSLYLGKWYPAWEADSELEHGMERTVLRYHSMLKGIADKIRPTKKDSEITFLDLGSGDGTICEIALLSGFTKSSGIEVDDQVNSMALEGKTILEEKEIIASNSVQLNQGSYYLREYWDQALENWQKKNPDILDAMTILSDEEMDEIPINDNEGLAAKVKEKLNQYREMDQAIRNLTDPKDGKLNVDAMFLYPSDIVILESKNQWDNIVRAGTYFVIAKSSTQSEKLLNSNVFESYEKIPLEGEQDQLFAIYKKK